MLLEAVAAVAEAPAAAAEAPAAAAPAARAASGWPKASHTLEGLFFPHRHHQSVYPAVRMGLALGPRAEIKVKGEAEGWS